MGEKPMGMPVDDEELGPEAAAGGINTTRSGIKNQTGVAADAGGAGEAVGGESAGTTINTTRDNIKTQGVTGDPIPGIDTK